MKHQSRQAYSRRCSMLEFTLIGHRSRDESVHHVVLVDIGTSDLAFIVNAVIGGGECVRIVKRNLPLRFSFDQEAVRAQYIAEVSAPRADDVPLFIHLESEGKADAAVGIGSGAGKVELRVFVTLPAEAVEVIVAVNEPPNDQVAGDAIRLNVYRARIVETLNGEAIKPITKIRVDKGVVVGADDCSVVINSYGLLPRGRSGFLRPAQEGG